LRIAKGLKQEDLEKWNFSYRYYGRLERGSVNPTLDTLARLCEIFGITLADLFLFMNADERIVTEEKEAILVKISELMKENKKKKLKKLRVFLDEIL
jgi:transcriptional regulator with XRE-family HTH domain